MSNAFIVKTALSDMQLRLMRETGAKESQFSRYLSINDWGVLSLTSDAKEAAVFTTQEKAQEEARNLAFFEGMKEEEFLLKPVLVNPKLIKF